MKDNNALPCSSNEINLSDKPDSQHLDKNKEDEVTSSEEALRTNCQAEGKREGKALGSVYIIYQCFYGMTGMT